MTSPRRPTIRDVARLAGVSHQTVSRRLRRDPTVSSMLAAHIDQAVAQLDYRPNLVARAMRNRSTGRLALVLPAGDALSSLEVLAGANEAAQSAGFAVEVVTLPPGELRGGRVEELADSGLYEAVLSLTDLSESDRPRLGGVPIISAPVYDEKMRGVGPLSEASRMSELVTQLAAQGHREFLHLTGDHSHPSSQRRSEAFLGGDRGQERQRAVAGRARAPGEGWRLVQITIPQRVTVHPRFRRIDPSDSGEALRGSRSMSAVVLFSQVASMGQILAGHRARGPYACE